MITRMAQEGFEPSASLVLSESGLPVAYRAKTTSSGGWNRTSGLHVQSVASLPAATTPESSSIREGGFEPPPPDSKSGSLPVSRFPRASRGSRTRLSDLGSPCLYAARPNSIPDSADRDLGFRFAIKSERDRGFEPRSPGWKPGVVPLDQSRVDTQRKERESNPQGSSLARFRVGCRRQSACPSGDSIAQSRACAEVKHRREESNLQSRLNRAAPYRLATPVSQN